MENSLLFRFLSSSLGKKVVMALTGLFLCVFLCEHLYTNLLLFAGDGGVRFNEASEAMVHNLLVRIVEFVLFGAIIVHTIQAVKLTGENNAARPRKYAVNGVSETSSWFSRNMLPTGAIILFFLVVHLKTFFVPYRLTHEVGGLDQMTLAQTSASVFANPLYSLVYLVGVTFLAMHLNHGFQSAFQTLGINNRRYADVWKGAGTGFAILIGLGFASFPIVFYLSSSLGWDILNWNVG